MKQYINLYARLEPPKPVPRALLAIGSTCLVVLLCYAVAAGFLLYGGQELRAALDSGKTRLWNLQAEITSLQSEDQAIDLAPQEQKLTRLRQQLRRQQTLLAYLEDPARLGREGFSEAMTGLARQHVNGVAIEKFELTHEGRRLLLAGKLGHADSLPEYIQRLGSEAAFAQMSFEKININEVDGELDFEISSLAKVEAGS